MATREEIDAAKAKMLSMPDEDLQKLVPKREDIDTVKQSMSAMSDEELNKIAYGVGDNGPSIGETVAGGIGKAVGWAADKMDAYGGGASSRAAAYELTRSRPEFNIGENINNAISAGKESYGSGAANAPQGRDILADNFGVSDKPGKLTAPAPMNEIDRQLLLNWGYTQDEKGQYVKEGVSKAENLGAAVDMALDPLNALALGAKALSKGVATGAKLMNRGLFGVKLEKDVEKIKAASEVLGIKPTPGQLLDSATVKKLENAQAQSHGMAGGWRLRKQIESNQKAAKETAEEIFSARSRKSKVESGGEFEKKFMDELYGKLEPAEQVYGAWTEALRETGLPVSKRGIAEKIDDLRSEVKFSPEGKSALLQVENTIDQLQSLDDVKTYRTTIGQKLKDKNTSNAERYVLSNIYSDLTKLRSDSLKELAKRPEYKDFAEQAIVQIGEADKIWADAANSVENALLSKGQKVKEGPKRAAKEFFEKNTDIQKVNKVLQTNDPSKIAKVAEDYPEAYQILREAKIEELAVRSEHKGKISPQRLVTNIEKLPKESKILIFGDKNAKKIEALKTIIHSLPDDINPPKSGLVHMILNLIDPRVQLPSIGRSMVYRGITGPELGTDVFSKIGASNLTTPIATGSVLLPKAKREKDQLGLKIPSSQGLQLPK